MASGFFFHVFFLNYLFGCRVSRRHGELWQGCLREIRILMASLFFAGVRQAALARARSTWACDMPYKSPLIISGVYQENATEGLQAYDMRGAADALVAGHGSWKKGLIVAGKPAWQT
jgi:hypothetical protein